MSRGPSALFGSSNATSSSYREATEAKNLNFELDQAFKGLSKEDRSILSGIEGAGFGEELSRIQARQKELASQIDRKNPESKKILREFQALFSDAQSILGEMPARRKEDSRLKEARKTPGAAAQTRITGRSNNTALTGNAASQQGGMLRG
jgi:seryl-tRNA synthetase